MNRSSNRTQRPLALIKRYLHDDSGAAAVEYGLIISSLSVLIVGGMAIAFDSIEWLFADNNSEINKVLIIED